MDPINWGVLNPIESVINNVFIQRPNVDAIQQWINSCYENDGISMNLDASPIIVQGASTPIVKFQSGQCIKMYH
jgi:hypothetical protein